MIGSGFRLIGIAAQRNGTATRAVVVHLQYQRALTTDVQTQVQVTRRRCVANVNRSLGNVQAVAAKGSSTRELVALNQTAGARLSIP